jgi:tRNA/rRNA methyltransferase
MEGPKKKLPPRERIPSEASISAEATMANLVLVAMETADEANLGALCRAMKNFGVQRLRAVAPRCEDPKSARARALACDAVDILEAAATAPTLDDACRLEEIELLAASTARRSSRRGPFLTPAEFAAEAIPLLSQGKKIGLLLGREDRGLANDEVDRCRWKVSIPTSTALPSLNVAQAAIVLLAALWEAAFRQAPQPETRLGDGLFGPEMATYKAASPARKQLNARQPASAEDIGRLMAALETTATRIGYTWQQDPEKSMRPFRQIAARAGLTRREVGILKTFLRQTLYRLDHLEEKNPEEKDTKSSEKKF